MKRLLLLAPHLEIGGADKFNLDLVERLTKQHAYQVTVVATLAGAHPLRQEFERLTPDVFTLNTFLPIEEYPKFIAELIRSRRPDTVLIANSRLGYELLPILRTTPEGPSFVDYLHIEDADSEGYPELSIRYSGFLDLTIVSSEHLKRWLIERGKRADHVEVCTTNIDSNLWDRSRYDTTQIRAKYGVSDGIAVVAYTARLCRQKQPDVLARTIQALRDRGQNFICLAAGDGELRQWLEKFIDRNGLEELRLLGSLPNEQVREVLAISDIYFLPSETEGIALALYEAMAMGAVPVAADVGGQSELVALGCGVLVAHGPGETEAYTDALYRLLSDAPLRRSMATLARRRIQELFTLEDMGARMALLLERAGLNSQFDPIAARGALAASAMPRKERRNGVVLGAIATMALIASPRNFKLKLKNLSLLARVMVSRQRRAQLSNFFDARYYVSNNLDLGRKAIAPLVHYAIQGYLENRHPSPGYIPERSHANDTINPILSRILRTHR